MKLYLAHSSNFDYQSELYAPLKQSLPEHEIFYPHELHKDGIKSKDIIPTCEIIIAEVSYPSTGQGIELGWADASNIPIICFYRKNSNISSALRFVSRTLIEYDSESDMIEKLRVALTDENSKVL
jgi:hypothetical protein